MVRKISDDYAEIFFNKTVAKGLTRQSVDTVNNKQMENLLRIWDNEKNQLGGNQWALYNCLTYWATHTQDLRKPEIAKYNRELQIASAMKSKQWTEMA